MLELLSSDEIRLLHVAAMEILEKIGIMIQHDRALNILKEAGANIDEKRKIVKIPEYLVREALKKTPSRVLLKARNPKFDILIGDGNSYFTNGFGAYYTIDLETGQRRLSTLKDLKEFTLLSDYFSAVDYIKPNIIPQDVPKNVLEQTTTLIIFRNAEKHCSVLSLTPEGFWDVIKMAICLAGGEEEFLKTPSIIDAGFNNVPPLKYSAEIIEMILECAKYKIPFDISSGALAGGSAPVTLAGTIAQGVAENHAIVVLTQLVGPGTPIMWGSCATILDQRYGTAAYGSPENGLLHAAFIQMAHYYNIPYYGAAGVIDSKVPDAQAAYENALNALIATLAGADVVHDGVTGILETGITACYEQFAISNDISNAIKRIAQGIKVSKEKMALEIIQSVGHQKNHLTDLNALKFTKKHLLEEIWQPMITDRSPRSEWEKRGSKDIVQRAKEKVREVLATHKVEPLEKSVEQELLAMVKAKAKNINLCNSDFLKNVRGY